MTLEDAVEVLNERQHRHYSLWTILSGDGKDKIVARHRDGFNEFEAIAIAEKYQRESRPKESDGQ